MSAIYNNFSRTYKISYKPGKKVVFAQQSYTKWATREIERYVAQNKGRPIVEVLEEYCHKMDAFACQARTDEAKLMFSVAYDVGMDVLDIYIQ